MEKDKPILKDIATCISIISPLQLNTVDQILARLTKIQSGKDYEIINYKDGEYINYWKLDKEIQFPNEEIKNAINELLEPFNSIIERLNEITKEKEDNKQLMKVMR